MSKKHYKLTEHLKGKLKLLNLNKENFESSMANVEIIQTGFYHEDNSLSLCATKTECWYYFENIKSQYLPLLIAYFSSWLYQNDDCKNERDFAEIKITVVELEDKSENKLLNLVITLIFHDEVYLQETVNGPIELDGIKYDEGTATIDVAEAGTVNGA
ncbi:phage tail protein [Lentisphaerota bacterium WC36G]|nr:phage tail protein [Lentisphaerae bacterium WC36]